MISVFISFKALNGRLRVMIHFTAFAAALDNEICPIRPKTSRFEITFFKTGPEVIKLFSCSTQLSMKFEILISIKISRNSAFFSDSDKPRMLFFLLINVKMPTIVGILTFMSRKKFMLS